MAKLLDPAVVARGSLAQIAIVVPSVLVVRTLRQDDLGATSSLWLVAAFLALIVAPAAAGGIVGRRRPDSPLIHAVAATGAAWALLGAVSVVRSATQAEDLSPLLISLLTIAPIQISIGILAATFCGSPTEPEETEVMSTES